MTESLDTPLPEAAFSASTFAHDVDSLFYTMVIVFSFTALVVAILIIVFCIKYRDSRDVNRMLRNRNPHWLEYLWIGIPTVIFMIFFFWGANLYWRFQQTLKDPLLIRVVAKQWMWKIYHPGGQGEINELHIPVNQPIQLRLASEDVIHSFFVPAFRVKQDAVPGRYNQTGFTANRVGRYRLFCAEFCGTQHSKMRGVVTVMEADDYKDWLNQQKRVPTLAQSGEALFRSAGCGDCHDEGDTQRAPSLVGVSGRLVSLKGGRRLIADSAYLRDAILLPEKDVVIGYESIMPSYSKQFSEDEVFKLVSYISSLKLADDID